MYGIIRAHLNPLPPRCNIVLSGAGVGFAFRVRLPEPTVQISSHAEVVHHWGERIMPFFVCDYAISPSKLCQNYAEIMPWIMPKLCHLC